MDTVDAAWSEETVDLTLQARDDSDIELEWHAADLRKDLLEEVLARKITFQVTGGEGA